VSTPKNSNQDNKLKDKTTMLSTTTRLRVQAIIKRLEKMEEVTLYERIYLNKLASTSSLVRNWIRTALGPEATDIDSALYE
tara:strand:- start:593 stop:835 length:243 start_codon:yes stop_codon:yes gene_type:complete